MKNSFLITAALLVACVASSPNKAPVSIQPNNFQLLELADSTLSGIWYSASYGELLDLSAPEKVLYDVSGPSCVRSSEAEAWLTEYFTKYRFSDDRELLFLSSDVEPFEYRFMRLSSLLPQCLSPTPDTPTGNFQTFVNAFNRFYPFFDLYDVDWQSRVAAARARVSPQTRPEELFQLLRDMLKGLNDAHVKLIADIDGERTRFDANPGKTERALFERAVSAGENPMKVRAAYRQKYWVEDIQQTLLEGAGVMAADEAIQFGVVSDDIGMISLLTMGGYIEADGETEAGVLDKTLDEALSLFAQRGVKAVVVNLAMNYGGYDYISRSLAGRFAADPVRAYTKVSANEPDAEPFWYVIEPSDKARFTGPVYLLTSDVTVSAAEVATLAMRPLPNVVHVGETTRGALSDVLSRALPNGWELSLSSEVYRDHEGVLWEGRGIEPAVQLKIFNPNDPFDGFLDAMNELIAMIDEKH